MINEALRYVVYEKATMVQRSSMAIGPKSSLGPSSTPKNWVISFVFSVTARSASALAVAFFRLLEPFSYGRFDILTLMQASLLQIHRYPDYFEKKRKNLHEVHFAN